MRERETVKVIGPGVWITLPEITETSNKRDQCVRQ